MRHRVTVLLIAAFLSPALGGPRAGSEDPPVAAAPQDADEEPAPKAEDESGEKQDKDSPEKPKGEAGGGEPGDTGTPAADEDPEAKARAARRPLLLGEALTVDSGVTLLPVAPEPVEGAAPEPVPVQSLAGEQQRPVVLLFWSRTCPVCKRYVNRYATLAKEFGGKALFVFVTANRDEVPAEVVKTLKEAALALPVFADPEQAAATRLGVRVNPTALVFDAGGVLRYRGPLDDDRKAKKSREPVEYLRKALGSILDGKPVESPEPRPFGSAIRG